MPLHKEVNNEWSGGFMAGFITAIVFMSFLLWLGSDIWTLT